MEANQGFNSSEKVIITEKYVRVCPQLGESHFSFYVLGWGAKWTSDIIGVESHDLDFGSV